ncbi:MAG: hypothetical protein GVY33_07490 [Alphaproteobacteria bacterium]|nr:hypothetical protein [Alphaproteobacteria bacterium]
MRRRWSRPLVAVAAAAALAACATATLRDLDRMKQLSAAGDAAAVAATAVDCRGGPGCAQAHAIRADACLDLAGDAAVEARAEPAACARTGYDRALAALADHADPRLDAARLEAQRLEAIRLERDAVGLDRGLALNDTLAGRAAAFEAAGGAPGTAAFYAANATSFAVAFGEPAAPCARLAEAAAAAARAEAGSADAVAQLRRDIANLARLEGCAG